MALRPQLLVLQPTPYCNINCSYCYLRHRDDRSLMSTEVVEAIREKIVCAMPADSAPTIVWHAGEPTAAPIRWYESAHERLASAAPPQASFAMQSNGIAIDEQWIALFRRTGTNVSLSIDGPQRFHDQRRRTRNGAPTWRLAMRALKLLQDAGLEPRMITVLHPDGLDCADEYYHFYRDNDVTEVSFSIDEREGANAQSSFEGRDHKGRVTTFLVDLLERAYRDEFPLHVREVERIAQILVGATTVENELVDPWAAIVVAADGSVSTFSPELMEAQAPAYNNFVFGNILDGDFERFASDVYFQRSRREVAAGVAACKAGCRYFAVCGGGSPVNKLCEKGDLAAAETEYCRLSVQSSADALLQLLARFRDSTGPAKVTGETAAWRALTAART
jgi:uncharacterized protein